MTDSVFRRKNDGDVIFFCLPLLNNEIVTSLIVTEDPTYTKKEVLELLIRCKNTFGGLELYDQFSDGEVKEWFENTL